jgi:alpha-ketoglutarate-dependent taurine dioxygenase
MNNLDNEIDSLRLHGWTLIKSNTHENVLSVFKNFGPVIQTAEVCPKNNSRAAVNTVNEMELHTDHPRARWISWECIRQSSEGGYSLLKDTYLALKNIPSNTLEELTKVFINTHHKVFNDDLETYPVLREDGDKSNWVYYTPWFDRNSVNKAREAFLLEIDKCPVIKIRLQPSDILLIDNGRMLHGRTAIGGDQNRLLIRRWIASPFDKFLK